MSIYRIQGAGQPRPPRLNEIARQIAPRVLQKSQPLADRGQTFCVSPTSMLCARLTFTWRRILPRLALPNLLFEARCFEWADLPLVERRPQGMSEGILAFSARSIWVHRTEQQRCFDMVVDVLNEDPELIRLTRSLLNHPSIRTVRPEIPFTLVAYNPKWVTAKI